MRSEKERMLAKKFADEVSSFPFDVRLFLLRHFYFLFLAAAAAAAAAATSATPLCSFFSVMPYFPPPSYATPGAPNLFLLPAYSVSIQHYFPFLSRLFDPQALSFSSNASTASNRGSFFVVACTRLYNPLWRSFHRLVGRLVGWLVGPSRSSRKVGKHSFPPLPTRPRLVLAVYPALLF